MVVSTYVGSVVLKGGLEGTDATVNNSAASHTKSWFGFSFTADALGQMGEYIGFSLAGVVGGLIVGYSFPSIFGKKKQYNFKGGKKLMLEWLTGDPLSGILTTIFFFVFLIVGRKLDLNE